MYSHPYYCYWIFSEKQSGHRTIRLRESFQPCILGALLLIIMGTYQEFLWGQSASPPNNPFSQAYQNPFGKLPMQPTLGDKMMVQWLRAETLNLELGWAKFADELTEWKSQQEIYREQLQEMLGLDPWPDRQDLQATVTGRLHHAEFTVENLHFQSLPGLYCTANLYLPKNATQPAPAILYLCGHGAVKENGISYGNKVHYQHHGAWFARNGYVCLVLDSVQLGELEGIHHGTHRHDMWWWNSRGFSSAGPEAWNCIRAVDYLTSRDEVDPDRLGVTGRSGGGAYSWWVAALDQRIKVACPVAGITDMRNHNIDGCIEGHCDCMFMVNTYRWDYGMVAALVAPRPLLFCNTDKDRIFPLDGVMRLYDQTRKFYDLLGESSKLGIAITEGGHQDTQELQLPVMRWFNRWLKNSDAPISNYAEKYFKPQELRVFSSLPEDEITTHCFDSFTRLADDSRPLSIESAVADLQAKTLGAWPEAVASDPVRLIGEKTAHGVRLSVYEFTSQPHVDLRFYLVQHADAKPESITIELLDDQSYQANLAKLIGAFGDLLSEERKALLALSEVSATSEAGQDVGHELSSSLRPGDAKIYFAPRCSGLYALGGDARYKTHVRRRVMQLGTTLPTMQAWDIKRMAETLRTLPEMNQPSMKIIADVDRTEVACLVAIFGPKLSAIHLAASVRPDQQAADFLNWSRIVTPKQLLQLVQLRTQVVLGTTTNP